MFGGIRFAFQLYEKRLPLWASQVGRGGSYALYEV